MEIFLGTLFGVGLFVWLITAENRSFNERIKLIYAYHKEPNWKELGRAYDRVSFGKHVWYRVTFRDPWKIYPPIIQKFLKDLELGDLHMYIVRGHKIGFK